MKSLSRLRALLDLHEPYYGPCGICGQYDARHWLLEAITSARRHGQSVEVIADYYGMHRDLVEALGTSNRAWARVLAAQHRERQRRQLMEVAR